MIPAEEIVDDIIRREGSAYTNRPADRGGPTKWGITLTTLQEERGPLVGTADLQRLTEADARGIYRERFIRRPRFSEVTEDEGVRALLVDYGVHSGPKRAAKALQLAVGAIPDGKIGADTLLRLEAALAPGGIGARALHGVILADRLRFVVDIVLADPATKRAIAASKTTQLRNLRGWVNRLTEFL